MSKILEWHEAGELDKLREWFAVEVMGWYAGLFNTWYAPHQQNTGLRVAKEYVLPDKVVWSPDTDWNHTMMIVEKISGHFLLEQTEYGDGFIMWDCEMRGSDASHQNPQLAILLAIEKATEETND